MNENSAYHDHEYFGKYFKLLLEGNTIASRLHHNIISEHTAKVLFSDMVQKLADAIAEEKKNNK